MKKSELKQIIKEVIQKLNESFIDVEFIQDTLKKNSIKVKSVEKVGNKEFVITTGIANKTGIKWEYYQDSIYTALKEDGWKGENDSISIYIE